MAWAGHGDDRTQRQGCSRRDDDVHSIAHGARAGQYVGHRLRCAANMETSAKPAAKAQFDSAYYRRFYLTAATRAMSREQTEIRGALIAALVKQLDIPVKRILDVG